MGKTKEKTLIQSNIFLSKSTPSKNNKKKGYAVTSLTNNIFLGSRIKKLLFRILRKELSWYKSNIRIFFFLKELFVNIKIVFLGCSISFTEKQSRIFVRKIGLSTSQRVPCRLYCDSRHTHSHRRSTAYRYLREALRATIFTECGNTNILH